MKAISLRLQMTGLLAAGLAVVWLGLFYELNRSRERFMQDAQETAVLQAQAYAEHSRTTFKRLEEVLLDLRDHWGASDFTEEVQKHQDFISDIAFQIGIIDKDGFLAYSNLQKAQAPVDLSQREHFKVHKDSLRDRLFISKPVKGKVSGRWSLQFTRPILNQGKFEGVLVLSVDPSLFVGYHQQLNLGGKPALTMIADDGSLMARFPDNDEHMGKSVSGTPFQQLGATDAGVFSRTAQVDGVVRIYGYYKLREYKMNYVVGKSQEDVLAPYYEQRSFILMAALFVSLGFSLLVLFLHQTLAARQQARSELESSEERYHSLFTGSKVPELIIDPDDGRIVDANKAAIDYYGYPEEKLKQMKVSDINIATKEEVAHEMERAKLERRSHFHFRHRLASGEVRDVDVHSGPIPLQSKIFLYSLIHDETERLRLERERRKLIRAVEQSPVSIMITNKEGMIEYVNPRFLENTGYSLAEVLNENPRFLKSGHTPPETYTDLWGSITRGGEWHGELCNRKKNGELYWEQASITAIADSKGNITHFLGVKEDITEKRRIGEELKRSNAELEQFAYVASHDLRQPLRMVSSYLQLIEKKLGPDIDADMKDFMGFALGGAKRMDQLIVSLLEYSRVGRSAEPFGRVDLGEVIRESRLNLEVAIVDASAEVFVEGNFPTINGHWMELVRLFQNLVGNALKYRSPDRPCRIEISCLRDGSEWIVTVQDNGMGMDPKDHARAFGIFQRLVRNDQYEGTGIGLAVCKKIVEHHKGRIWIESALDEGCRFYLALPAVEA